LQQISPNELNFDAIWAKLEANFRHVHTKEVSTISFEDLYRDAYRLVLKKKGEHLYHQVVAFEQKWLEEEVRKKINAFITPEILASSTSGSTAERRFAGDRFLKGIKDEFVEHNTCMCMLSDVLLYLVCSSPSNHVCCSAPPLP
jgi:cullin 3